MRWAYDSIVCPHHGIRHLRDDPCPVCEDGEEFHNWKPCHRFRGTPTSSDTRPSDGGMK